MIRNSSQDPAAASSNTSQAPAAPATEPNPRAVIEVASSGTGTTNDPSGTDKGPVSGTGG